MTVLVAEGARRHDIDAALARIAASRRHRRRRSLVASTATAAIGLVLFCVSLSRGDYPIPLGDVVATLLGGGDPRTSLVVLDLRLPRALTGVCVGAAFGVSGALFQSLARNPLASPDIIGITAGASAAAVFLIVVVGASQVAVSVGALLGAIGAALCVYLLAHRRGVSPYRLVLVGIGVAAALAAVTEYLLVFSDLADARRAAVWLTGSLNGRGWPQLGPLLWALAALGPATVLLLRPLRALQLGDAMARGAGVAVERSRLGLLLVGVALAAVATAAAGPVAFVAFVAAPIARRLSGTPLAMVTSALIGATLVVGADLVGGELFGAAEVPVGVVTGAIGGPYLLWLLARSRTIGTQA